MNLFLDDIRDPPNDGRVWIVARSYEEAVQHVVTHGVPNYISFDHDLGENVPTGKDFANWLVDMHLDERYIFPSEFNFYVHSANTAGAENIQGLMDGFLRFLVDNS